MGFGMPRPVGVLWAAFYGLCAVFSAAFLVPHLAYLRLADDGFRFRWLRAERFVSWSEVESFGVKDGYRGSKYVEYVFVRHYRELPSAQGRRYTFGGGSRVLPDTYGVRAETLAGLMNSLRAEFGGRSEDPESET
jgi:hypothetical protein